MLHACIQSFDVTSTVQNFLRAKQSLIVFNYFVGTLFVFPKPRVAGGTLTVWGCECSGLKALNAISNI